MTRTMATPSRCRVDVVSMNEMLISAFQVPPGIIGMIQQDGFIGEGRFGTCKKVSLHGTMICAKTLRSSNGCSKSAILHEAAMLSRVRHPNIAFLIGIQTIKEPFQLLCALYSVENISLSVYDTSSFAKVTDEKKQVLELLRPSLTLQVWLAMMKNLAEALAFIHEKSIVHRDLKSDNVVLNKHDSMIHCVLVDFGKSNHVRHVKRYVLSQQEKEQYRINHKHIAPDLVDGMSDVSTASDIYSYGRLFKNIVTYYPLPIELLSSSLKENVCDTRILRDLQHYN